MYETGEETEKVLLVAVAADGPDSGADSAEESLDELAELLEATGASGIVTDDELTPVQMKNLENALSCNVMDRTMVILDIFAQHAMTGEGKLQVELAQLRYRSSRLVGMGRAMSRLGGGIGTRGPGEKKLEVDRRTIRNRIAQLNRELAEVKKNRDVRREQRMRSAIPVIAIVGYTNAGKSTLLNRLTDAGVLSKDALFATLDPTTRNYHLPSGQEVLFTDTVGFIRKLPHHLIDAFRSTLEEAKYSDLILHVVDASNKNADVQMAVDLFALGGPEFTAYIQQSLRFVHGKGASGYFIDGTAAKGTGLSPAQRLDKILPEARMMPSAGNAMFCSPTTVMRHCLPKVAAKMGPFDSAKLQVVLRLLRQVRGDGMGAMSWREGDEDKFFIRISRDELWGTANLWSTMLL